MSRSVRQYLFQNNFLMPDLLNSLVKLSAASSQASEKIAVKAAARRSILHQSEIVI
jgi:hypothetical protein